MYKKYKPPLYSIPEKHESQDDLPANWIPKKKHEVLRVKYKCLKRLFKVYDSQINNLIEEYLKLRVNSEENIKKSPEIKKESSNNDIHFDKIEENCDIDRNYLEQSTTTNSLGSLNLKLQKCTIGPLLFEVIGDHLTDLSSRESLKLPKHYLNSNINKENHSSEENFDNSKHNTCSLARHDLQVKNDVINVTNYDDFKNYFDKGMETSTQDLLESILACTQTSKSLFEDGNSLYLSRKLSPIQYLRRKLCNRNRPSTTKSDIVDRTTKTCQSSRTNSPSRVTAVSEPIYDRRINEPRRSCSYKRRGRRRIHFKQFNSSNRITSNQEFKCQQSKIGDIDTNFEERFASDGVSPKRSPVKIDCLSFKSSISNEKQGNCSNYYQANSTKDTKSEENDKEFQNAKIYLSTLNRQNNFSVQSPSPANKILYKCSFCHKEFKLKISKDLHENTRHSFTKLVSRFTTFTKENDESYFESALRREPPVEILTPVVRRIRPHKHIDRPAHKRNFNTERKHYCIECNTIFSNREDLDFHFRLMHDVSKYHVCKICSLHFKNRSELTEHCEQYHFEEDSTCGSFYNDEKSSSEENLFAKNKEQIQKRKADEFMKNKFRNYNSVSASSSINPECKNRIQNTSYKSISQKTRSSPIFRRRNFTDSSDSIPSQNNNKNFEEVKRDLIDVSYQRSDRNSNVNDKKYLNRRWQTASKMQSM